MINAIRFFESGFIYRNQALLGRLSIALPIALEAIITLGRIKGFYDQSQKTGGFKKAIVERIQTIDKRKLAITLTTATVIIVAGILFVQTGAFAASLAFLKQTALMKQIGNLNIWNLPVPPENKATVYPSYIAAGLASFYSSYKQMQGKEKNYTQALMHAGMGVISCAAPVVMQLGWYDVRWHHLSYGILCTLTESRSLQMFGTAMSLDSVGYWVLKNPSHFGFDNIFVNNLVPMTATLAGCTAWQLFSK